jgi:cobalt/nickel transport system permease protein
MLFAIHIYEGMITPTWCVGGFIVAAMLVFWGAWRVREEEIARIAVLTAAFFVAALIHVPVPGGPPTHLLLGGLLGVVLGRRAALAIPVGLFLHAVLFQHGSLSTLGANTCVMVPPAIVSWLLFQGLCRVRWLRQAWFRAGLVMVSAGLFVVSGVYAAALLIANWGADVKTVDLTSANELILHPAVIAPALVVALLAACVEYRLKNAAEFPLGLLIGELSVLLTILLNAVILILGSPKDADWHSLVLITFLVHLPVAVVEGIILGFTVGFLARVKPEMLLGFRAKPQAAIVPVVAVLLVFAGPGTADAHRLDGAWRVLPGQRIQVQCWFNPGGPAKEATVEVKRDNGEKLTEGKLDDNGLYTFHFAKIESLFVEISAGEGHGKNLTISRSELAAKLGVETNSAKPDDAAPDDEKTPFANTEEAWLPKMKDGLIGVGFLLALAAFLLSLHNQRQLQALQRRMDGPPTNNAGGR